jgi:hypothetical protein
VNANVDGMYTVDTVNMFMLLSKAYDAVLFDTIQAALEHLAFVHVCVRVLHTTSVGNV